MSILKEGLVSQLQDVADVIRNLSLDMVHEAKSGHIGLPLGCAELGALLFFRHLRFDAKHPDWINRDRFVLSAGHGSAWLYSLLYLSQYNLTIDDLKSFRQLHSQTPGHPERTAGIECTTGPLGQGFAHAVGLAMAEQMLAEKFSCIDHRTFALVGDGCLMEGVSYEAASLAGHLGLSKLIVFYDANRISIDGSIDMAFSEDVGQRFTAQGWYVLTADGHDFNSLETALEKAYLSKEKPTLIITTTIPGKGLSRFQGNHKVHGNPFKDEDVALFKKQNGFEGSFQIPVEKQRSIEFLLNEKLAHFEEWKNSVASLDISKKKEWDEFWKEKEFEFSQSELPTVPALATRQSFSNALQIMAEKEFRLVGGSADLAGSNGTTLKLSSFVQKKSFQGRNVHFGVREHAMAAITNGLTLHGLRGYCATFLVFSDYMRPSIRLAALMKLPSLFIFTHDSVFVGEDGPTHQPVEHASSLRLIPDLHVFRPADSLEVYLTLEEIVNTKDVPSVLLLTRQDVPDLDLNIEKKRVSHQMRKNLRDDGAYILRQGKEDVLFIASGSEVSLALDVDMDATIISVPNLRRFLSSSLLKKLTKSKPFVVTFELGSSFGWGDVLRYGKENSFSLSVETFGHSAPYQDLKAYFGFDKEGAKAKIKKQMS